jgi:hypothetical protein
MERSLLLLTAKIANVAIYDTNGDGEPSGPRDTQPQYPT